MHFVAGILSFTPVYVIEVVVFETARFLGSINEDQILAVEKLWDVLK